MKRRLLTSATVVAALLAATPQDGTAVPAFARQTGASCSSCHYQHFPALTPYGRFFKSGGYIQSGQDLIESRNLSLPVSFYASMIAKIRYVKTNGISEAGTDLGELQFPDEAAFFLGGRVGTHVGFLLEAQIADPDAPMFAAFKLPIGMDVAEGRLSVIPFSTDGLGTPFAFELLNTGAVRNVRAFEDRAVISAQQYVVGGSGEGEAEGVALAFARREGFVTVVPWTPNHGTVAIDRPVWYYRAALTPRVGSWDLAAGVQYWTGMARTVAKNTRAWAVDAQAQGRIVGRPAGLYLTYARAEGTPFPENGLVGNYFNPEPYAQWAAAATLEFGVVTNRLTLGGGYRRAETGAASAINDDNAAMAGATFQFAENVQLQVNHVWYHGNVWSGRPDDQKTIVMLFAAF